MNESRAVISGVGPSAPEGSRLKRILFPVLVSALLVAVSFAAFWPVLRNGFVVFDDNVYVTENPWVRAGLGWPGVRWAFTTFHGANWHPLTWLSHQLDVSLFGLRPFGHHLVNLLLHATGAVILFLLLAAATGSPWAAAFTAALFAVHPLHVESVAWVAERKDVLSACFWFLTMAAWLGYVRRPGLARYALVLLLFALGLMAKPMLVTLPLVLLLFDRWPLGRFEARPSASPGRLLAEKLPLLALSAVSSAITLAAQRQGGAVVTMSGQHSALTIPNAFVSYLRYLGKLLWPANLAVFYPFLRQGGIVWRGAGSLLALVVITCLLFRWARRWPWAAVGWLWYLVTLVPVAGFIKVGSQSIADRYTYLPSVGLFLALAWLAGSLGPPFRHRAAITGAAALSLIMPLVVLTRIQAGYWRNEMTLMKHASEVTEGNWMVHNNYGMMLARQGRLEEAIAELRRSLAISENSKSLSNLGLALTERGNYGEAETFLRRALALDPRDATARMAVANLLGRQGKAEEALAEYRMVLRTGVDVDKVHTAIAGILSRQGRAEEALEEYRQALRVNPFSAVAHNDMGVDLFDLGRVDEAIAHYRQALRLEPWNPEAMSNLANALLSRGETAEAIYWYQETLRFQPGNAMARILLQRALTEKKSR